MRTDRVLQVIWCVVMASCTDYSTYHSAESIVGGTAQIVSVEAWSDDRTVKYADLTSHYSGSVTVDAGLAVSGAVKIDGVEHAVVGVVQQEGSNFTFEVSELPPQRLIVIYDNGDQLHYTLLGSFLLHGDVTGDSIPENYRLLYHMTK